MNYDVVIGIEIHLELKTKTKMFSSAPTTFASKANSAVNEIDFAFPGTLPSVNKEAVKKALEVCFAFGLEIDKLLKFDRKNYFYSDLPKGFQITQQFFPIGRNGKLNIKVDGANKEIRINRIHLEEDTAKQFHLNDKTYIDFNRAGNPLIEIVSEADMSSGLEASLYVEKLRQTLLFLGVSDCRMEEGSMRCDVNISLKEKGSSTFGTKVEIKNLNSISNIKNAIEYEILRQSEILNKNEKVTQETRRFDEATQTTVLMRKKEGNVDYKYFPEPNIKPILLSDEFIKNVKNNLKELPDSKIERYSQVYGLNDYDIGLILSNYDVMDYFEKVMVFSNNPKNISNLINSELLGLMTKNNIKFSDLKISPKNFSRLSDLIVGQEISGKQGKEVLELMLSGDDVDVIVETKGFKQISDESFILQAVLEVIDEQKQSVIDYHNGKDRALGFLVGQLMKKTKGQANPALASSILKKELEKFK